MGWYSDTTGKYMHDLRCADCGAFKARGKRGDSMCLRCNKITDDYEIDYENEF